MPVPLYAPCQATAGYGDVGAWQPQSGYTRVAEGDKVTCLAASQTWQATGGHVMAGESLSVIAGGEADFGTNGTGGEAYCYPEGSYPGYVRHYGPPTSGPAPTGDAPGYPILSLLQNL